MVAHRRSEDEPLRRPPATTPEGRENQLIAAAFDLAERQILEGTASSQVISHFLKRGSGRETLEEERLRGENDLLRAKIEQMASASNVEKLYADAIDAMRSYSGQPPVQRGNDDYEDDD